MSYKSSLVGYWPLDEDAGSNAFDYSPGRGRDGNANGAGPSGTGTSAGPIGSSAYDFDGTDDYVQFSSPVIDSTVEHTFVCWIRRTSDNGKVFETNDNTNGIRINIASKTLYYQTENSDTVYGVSSSDYAGSEWTHVGCVYDGSTQYLYLNGVEKGTTSSSGSGSDPNNARLGADTAGTNYFEGQISNVRIYQRPLTPQEIQHLYLVGSGGSFTSPVLES